MSRIPKTPSRSVPAAAVSVAQVTYSEDVAPIIQKKCQSCHRPGQVGPFALLTFEQARRGRDDPRGGGQSPDAAVACRRATAASRTIAA